MNGDGPAAPSPAARGSLALEVALVLAAALALYVSTVAPGVLWQDSGMAQVRVLERDLRGTLGLALAHPLYYSAALLFQNLPFADSAYKTNLVSAVFGAVAVASLYTLLRVLAARRTAAACGAISLAVAHTFWQHCTLAEVYTLSLSLLLLELVCLALWQRTRGPAWIVALFFFNGLGFANHLLAVLSLACYGIFSLVQVAQRRLKLAVLLLAILTWFVGALPMWLLIAQELREGATLGATLHSTFFGIGFADKVLNVLPSAQMLIRSGIYLGLNYPTPAFLLIFVGFFGLRRSVGRPLSSLLVALLLVHLVWAIRYKVPDQYTFFLPAVTLLAVFVGLGAERILAAPRGAAWTPLLLLAAVLPVGVYVSLPTVAQRWNIALPVKRELPFRDEYRYFLWPWKAGEHGPARFAEAMRSDLPDWAVLVADDTAVRPIHYLQRTGRWQRRVLVIPEVGAHGLAAAQPDLLAEPLRMGRLFVVTPARGYCPQWLLDQCDFVRESHVWRAVPRSGPATAPASAP